MLPLKRHLAKAMLGLVLLTGLSMGHGAQVQASLQQHGNLPGQPPPANHAPWLANKNPIGTDPLTTAELALVLNIATNNQQPIIHLRPNVPLLSPVQYLFAERHEGDKAALPTARRADVFFYNYATDQVIRQVVNLRTAEVEATQVRAGEGHQPPVAEVEAQAALQMILAHPALSRELQQAYLHATGNFLLRAEQLQPQGILYVPSVKGDAPMAKVARACQKHRCVQLFLQVGNTGAKAATEMVGMVGMIDANNVVVDLSAGQVLWAEAPFRAFVFEDAPKQSLALPKQHEHRAGFACATGQPLVITMTIGTRWGLCWTHELSRGLVLNQISFAPRNGEMMLILGSAALAQVVVAGDGAARQHLLSEGGLPLKTLTPNDCSQGVLLPDGAGAPVLCQRVQPRGYAWRGVDPVQGQSLLLFGISRANGQMWTHQWAFDDDGAIHPMLGISGRSTNTRTLSAYWRLNFDVGGSANDLVEQFEYGADPNNAITRTQTALAFTRETSSTFSPQLQRFWRVKDTALTNNLGQSISYQIVPQVSSIFRDGEAFTQSDLFVTQNNACEQFVSRNPIAGGCGAQVNDFVNGEPLDTPSNDAVVWYGTTWHQTPAKEDERLLRTHWQGLTLLPRDFMDSSPLQTAPSVTQPHQPSLAVAGSSTLNCSSAYQITPTFGNTARWEMCWEPRAGYGYRLNQISFAPAQGAPRLILSALHVALMFVPYDDGGPRYRDTSLGKLLTPLTAADCPNGALLPGEVLCLTQREHAFVVHGYFNVANYYYVIQFTFYDDGSIEPAVGASGSLQRYIRDASTGWPVRGLVAANHNHWVIWRADFDLDGAASDVAKQFDGVSGLNTLTETTLLTETKTQHDLNHARFWRVYADSGPNALTYQIAPNVTDLYRAEEAFTQNDFYWTHNHRDEALVSDAFGLDGFVNGEAVQDGVAWYGVNFHHVPRAEDDGRMPIHWQGFVVRLQDRGWGARLFMPMIMRLSQ